MKIFLMIATSPKVVKVIPVSGPCKGHVLCYYIAVLNFGTYLTVSAFISSSGRKVY